MLAFVIFALLFTLSGTQSDLTSCTIWCFGEGDSVQKTVSTTEMLQNVHLVALTMVMQHYVENFASITEMLM